jgi:hypothetical protein
VRYCCHGPCWTEETSDQFDDDHLVLDDDGSCKGPPPDCRRIVIRLRYGIKGRSRPLFPRGAAASRIPRSKGLRSPPVLQPPTGLRGQRLSWKGRVKSVGAPRWRDTLWRAAEPARTRCKDNSPGSRSGDGPLSVRGCPSTVKGASRLLRKWPTATLERRSLCTPSGQKPRARQQPARTGRGPSPARCTSHPIGEQCRARCVPDQTVIPGISRSLRGKPPSELTCGYEAYNSGAHVLLSSRSHGMASSGQ